MLKRNRLYTVSNIQKPQTGSNMPTHTQPARNALGRRSAPQTTTSPKALTLRALLIGAAGSAVITTSSLYVALKLGALPWPIVFVALMSLVALRTLGNTTLSEVNVAHTAMSAGAMIAGGLAFTIPGIWMIDPAASVSWVQVLLVSICGTVLGLIFAALIRKHFVVNQNLTYPMGHAAAQTLIAAQEGGAQARTLFGALGISAVLTMIRDIFQLVPKMLFSGSSLAGIPLAVYFSPMMMSVGYMVGLTNIGVWVVGALIGHFGILSAAPALGIITSPLAETIRSSFGIGIMLGCGVGVLIKNVLPQITQIFAPLYKKSAQDSSIVPLTWAPVVIVLIVALCTIVLKFSLVASMLCIIGSWIAVTMAAQSVGDTSIDPMEVFAVIMLLITRMVTPLIGVEAFFFAAIIAIACGLAGDVMSDFKAGQIISTSPRDQWIGQAVGAAVGAVISVGVLYLLVAAYGTDSFGMNKEFIAVQAGVVSTMIGGAPHMGALLAGLFIGVALYLIGAPVMTLGLGVYLPFYITLTASIGGIVRLCVLLVSHLRSHAQGGDKTASSSSSQTTQADATKGLVIASGMLGGEAVVSVLIALFSVATGFIALS